MSSNDYYAAIKTLRWDRRKCFCCCCIPFLFEYEQWLWTKCDSKV